MSTSISCSDLQSSLCVSICRESTDSVSGPVLEKSSDTFKDVSEYSEGSDDVPVVGSAVHGYQS